MIALRSCWHWPCEGRDSTKNVPLVELSCTSHPFLFPKNLLISRCYGDERIMHLQSIHGLIEHLLRSRPQSILSQCQRTLGVLACNSTPGITPLEAIPGDFELR